MALEKDLVFLCLEAAKAMSVYVEVISQRGGRHSGTSRGAPDFLVYVASRCIPIELKRAKDPATKTPCGRLSLDQVVAIERRQAQGVETFVVTTLDEFVAVVNGARRGNLRSSPVGAPPRTGGGRGRC